MLESPDPCRETTIELFLYVFFIRSVPYSVCFQAFNSETLYLVILMQDYVR